MRNARLAGAFLALVLVLSTAAAAGTGATSRILRLNVSDTAVQFLDPALNYDYIGWRLEFATCARLLSYPDKPGAAAGRLVPEAAAGFPRISADGKRYTFTVRTNFRFSDGTRVTPGSFARAVERALDPRQQSPAASFIGDLAGADRVLAGKATRPSGLRVAGDTITFVLTEARPDFLSRLAMPFFCAVPENLRIDPKGVNVLPGAGPYYVAAFEPDRSATLRRNPYYGGSRPQRWDELRITFNVDVNQSYLQVRRGEADLDLGSLPPSAHSELTKRYKINRGRYFVVAAQTISYIALNTSRPFFRDVAARQAVAYAIDRTALMRVGGLNAGLPNDQILPPGIPGYRPRTIFPNRPNAAKARELLDGKRGTVVLYAGNDPTSKAQAQIIRANLGAVGVTVRVREFPFGVQIGKTGTRGEPFDMNLIGWFADYPDPYDFVNVLLYGKTITKANNVNTAYFDDPAFNAKMERAARTRGAARERAYAQLDLELTRAAPFVVFGNQTTREFVSERIGCPMATSISGGLNLVMLCERRR